MPLRNVGPIPSLVGPTRSFSRKQVRPRPPLPKVVGFFLPDRRVKAWFCPAVLAPAASHRALPPEPRRPGRQPPRTAGLSGPAGKPARALPRREERPSGLAPAEPVGLCQQEVHRAPEVDGPVDQLAVEVAQRVTDVAEYDQALQAATPLDILGHGPLPLRPDRGRHRRVAVSQAGPPAALVVPARRS